MIEKVIVSQRMLGGGIDFSGSVDSKTNKRVPEFIESRFKI